MPARSNDPGSTGTLPAAEAPGTVARDGGTVRFSGRLDRGAVGRLWDAALAASAGAERIVLEGVTSVDSAGLALLAELANGPATPQGGVPVEGGPQGLADLRAAYRLGPGLGFARPNA